MILIITLLLLLPLVGTLLLTKLQKEKWYWWNLYSFSLIALGLAIPSLFLLGEINLLLPIKIGSELVTCGQHPIKLLYGKGAHIWTILCAIVSLTLLSTGIAALLKNRTGFILITLYSLNPILWIINAIYLTKKWKALEKNYPEEWILRKTTYGLPSLLAFLGIIILPLSMVHTHLPEIIRETKGNYPKRFESKETWFNPPQSWNADKFINTEEINSIRYKTLGREQLQILLSFYPNPREKKDTIQLYKTTLLEKDASAKISNPKIISDPNNNVQWTQLHSSYKEKNHEVLEDIFFNFGKKSFTKIVVASVDNEPKNREEIILFILKNIKKK